MSLLDVQQMRGVKRIDYVLNVGTRTFAMQYSALGRPPFKWARRDPILSAFFHVVLPDVTLPASLRPASDLQFDCGFVFERLLRILYDSDYDLGGVRTEALAIMAVYANYITADRALRRIEDELVRRRPLVCDPDLLEFARTYGLQRLQHRCLYDGLLARGPGLEGHNDIALHELVDAVYGQAGTPLEAFLQLARIVARIAAPADELFAGQYVIVVDDPARMQYLTDLVMNVEFFAADLDGVVLTARMLRDVMQPGVQFQIQKIVRSLVVRQRQQQQQQQQQSSRQRPKNKAVPAIRRDIQR